MKTTNLDTESPIKYFYCPIMGLRYMFFGEPVRTTNKITTNGEDRIKRKINTFFSIVFCLFMSTQINAQESQVMSLGLDPELIVNGAYDYDSTPVLHAHFSWSSKLENKNEIGIKVSFANLNDRYFDYGFIYNHNINLLKSNMIETLIGTKAGFIHRSYPGFYSKKLYLNYELNAQARIWTSKKFGFYTKINFGPRHDLDYYGNHKAVSYELEIGSIFKF